MSRTCVCICTHDRHGSLQALLLALLPQLAETAATAIIVDNGTSSAAALVEETLAGVPHAYVRLAEPGLVASRNTALATALQHSPVHVAFIDDDETPDPLWLENLLRCMETTGCDLCFGPLRPSYAVPPPAWAEHGPFFWKTGKTYGTGNMMMRAAILPASAAHWFQPAFTFLGGEDEEFFARLVHQGARVAVASNAWVSETVPAQRLTLGYVMSTGARDGAIELQLMRQRGASLAALACGALWHAAKKLGYMAYHLALSWKASWHAVAALRDAAEIFGTLKALAGRSGRYYGTPTS